MLDLERGSPRTKPPSCGNQSAHESLLNRHVSFLSILTHPQRFALSTPGIFAMQQRLDSDHESRLRKKALHLSEQAWFNVLSMSVEGTLSGWRPDGGPLPLNHGTARAVDAVDAP
jgi:hypothetical protein